jgi:hypothetical protein
MRIGSHVVLRGQRSEQAFREVYGEHEADKRQAQIDALPSKDWKGVTVYRIACAGGFGKGAHELWVPERVLWALISLRYCRCPFHR